MLNIQLPGQFVMSVTPFGSDDQIDETLLRAQLRRLGDAGLGVYLGSPGTGEGHTLDLPELRRLYEIGVSELKGTVPVFASGRQPRGAKYLIELAREAEAAGIEALQVYPLDMGHGHRPTGGAGFIPGPELERYLREVLEAVRIPVLLSTHHGVGYGVSVDLLRRLVDDYDGIIGVNLTGPRIEYVARAVDALATKVKVFVGSSVHLLDNLALGGHGGVDWVPNITPKLSASVVAKFRAGDAAGAAEAWAKVIRIHTALNTDASGNSAFETPRGTKAAMKLLGLPGGELRAPFVTPEAEALDQIATALDELDVRSLAGL
jgi:4-hydroxy-tetrahydrodipicolinate synthase